MVGGEPQRGRLTTIVDPLDDLGAYLVSLSDTERAALLATLDEADLEVAAAAITRIETANVDWRNDPASMAHYLTNGAFRRWRYAMILGQKFKDAVEGRSIRQIWTLPPRYGKSQVASQWGPAWALDQNPSMRMILVSYGDALAMENAIGVRDILRNHRDVLRCQLRADRRAARRFVTTQGGGILAAGIGSSITGFGGHGAIFDDPFKNWQEAHSPTTRQSVDDAFRSVVSSRLDFADSFVIIPMTRWHGDDLVGRLLERMEDHTGTDWELVRMPELAEEWDPYSDDRLRRIRDPLGRAPGEPLEPERFPLESIKIKHLEAGTYLTASLYQQRPAPEEGGEIKRAWFRLEDSLPPAFDQMISSWDMKLKDKETGDYVVGQVWGRTGKDAWLIDQFRGQWTQAATECAIALCQVRHPRIGLNWIENTGNGPEVMIELRKRQEGYVINDDIASQLGMTSVEREAVQRMRRRGIGRLAPNSPKGPKEVRMRAESGHIEAGDVHLLDRAPFKGVYLDEMASFPGAHDDQVDATSQALAKLFRSEGASTSSATTQLPKTTIDTRQGGTLGVTAPVRSRRNRIMIPRATNTGR